MYGPNPSQPNGNGPSPNPMGGQQQSPFFKGGQQQGPQMPHGPSAMGVLGWLRIIIGIIVFIVVIVQFALLNNLPHSSQNLYTTIYTTIYQYTTAPYPAAQPTTTVPAQQSAATQQCAAGTVLGVGESVVCGIFTITLQNMSSSSPVTGTFAISAPGAGEVVNATYGQNITLYADGEVLTVYVTSYCITAGGDTCYPSRWMEFNANISAAPTTSVPQTTIPQSAQQISASNCSAPSINVNLWAKWPSGAQQSQYFGIFSSGQDAPQSVGYSECYGMPYPANYGVLNVYNINSSKTKLSFNWRAESGTDISTVTNSWFRVVNLANNQTIAGSSLVTGGTMDTGWQNYTAVLNTTGVTKVMLIFYTQNEWADYWAQKAMFSNVTVSSA